MQIENLEQLQIENLLKNLIKVILSYHKIRGKNPNDIYSDLNQYIYKSPDELFTSLNDVIKDFNSLEARGSLFYYLLNHIKMLKSFMDSDTPCSEERLSSFKQDLTHFFYNLQKFLTTAQSTSIVLNDQERTEVKGLAGSLFGLCESGVLINEHIFLPLKFYYVSVTQSEINNYIDLVVMPYHRSKLVDWQKKQIFKLEQTISELKEDLNNKIRSIEQMNVTICQQNKHIKVLEETPTPSTPKSSDTHTSSKPFKLKTPTTSSDYNLDSFLGFFFPRDRQYEKQEQDIKEEEPLICQPQ